ncbi:MAG: nitrogenase iron protein NifH [Dehalobacterium sp.]
MKNKRIAFYGKGGIGKSTIASNVSAILSKKGKKILHIGCDPKSDSTRVLVKKRIPTVLKTLKEKGNNLSKEDILFKGVYGVICVEAGGPEPGIGCAGMGISAAIEVLEGLEVFEMDWDLIIYDVLGDVVCGGFSIPMRKNCVDEVYIVTSAEFMSLYAANNILKGVENFSTAENRMFGGIIYNRWVSDKDKAVIDYFIKMIQGRLIASIRQSSTIKRAEYQKSTIFEINPQDAAALEIENLAGHLLDSHLTYDVKSLDDETLEHMVEFISKQEQEI